MSNETPKPNGKPHAQAPSQRGERCGAKTRKNTPCQQPAMASGRCRMHGGSTPTGIGLPQTSHGRFRKVPERLAGAYHESRNDPDLISTRDGIALISARVDELLSGMDAGESGELWKKARRAFQDFQRELRQQGDIHTPLSELEKLLEQGAKEAESWAEIDRSMKTIARLAETERRRVVDAQKMISPEELTLLVRGLEEAVTRNVADPETRTAISRDFQKALNIL